MVIALARPSRLSKRRAALILRHEVGHLGELDHPDMPDDIYWSKGRMPEWARGMPLRPSRADPQMTLAEGRKWKKELRKQIARDEKKKARAHMAGLRAAVSETRGTLGLARGYAKEECQEARVGFRKEALRERDSLAHVAQVVVPIAKDRAKTLLEQARMERDSARQRARSVLRNARVRASRVCEEGKERVLRARGAWEKSRRDVTEERLYRRQLRRAERGAKERHKEQKLRSKRVERGESDDEVRQNIPPELVPLFERVKRGIKASSYRSRTEAFLEYVAENPGEQMRALEEESEAKLERMIAEREGRKPRRRDPHHHHRGCGCPHGS